MLATTAAANALHRVDWALLERALDGYLAAPSDPAAAKITALLPVGMVADRSYPALDEAALDRIHRRMEALEPLASRGERHALRVAFALTEISDAAFTEWLFQMIGASIDSKPVAFLSELAANMRRSAPLCSAAAMLGEDLVDDLEGQRARRAARLRAIEAVTQSSLLEARECAAAELRE